MKTSENFYSCGRIDYKFDVGGFLGGAKFKFISVLNYLIGAPHNVSLMN